MGSASSALAPALAALLSLAPYACGRGSEADSAATAGARDEKPARAATKKKAAGVEAPRVEMRNLRLLVLENAELEVKSLSGALEPTADGVVAWFDDPNSFRIAIERADTSIDQKSLAALLNGYTFAYDGAPLADLEVEIDGDRVRQKGKLKKKLEVPFEVEASLSLTDDGLLRLHPEKIKAANVPVKAVLDLFDIELQELINARPERGIRVDGDDLLLDPSRLTPPPGIRGRVAEARLEPGRIVLVFAPPKGHPEGGKLEPPLDNPNYMFFRGGRLRFGRLEMTDTDLVIYDADPRDPFLFFLSQYQKQLVAGITRTLPDLGLVGVFPDYDETAATSGSGTASGASPRKSPRKPRDAGAPGAEAGAPSAGDGPRSR